MDTTKANIQTGRKRSRFYQKLTSSIILVVFTLLTLALPVGAADSPEPAAPEKTPEVTLTLNQAIALAIDNSDAIKKAGKEIDRTRELRDYANDQLNYIPKNPVEPQIQIPYASMLSADLTWQMSKKSYTSEEDSVALDTCKKYWDLLQAQEKLRNEELGLSKAQQLLANAQVSHRVGVVANPDLVAAEVMYSGSRASVETARNDLDKAFDVFNLQIGVGPQERPVLTEPAVYEPLEIQDLEREVSRVLETSPKLWLAKEMVSMQDVLADMALYTGAYTPYKARRIAVEQAELDYTNAKDLFKEITRSLYYAVIDLEEAYNATGESLRLAEENLRVKKLKFEVGMATKSEVTAAEFDVASAKKKQNDLAYQHAYMKLAFEKPWAYVSSGQ